MYTIISKCKFKKAYNNITCSLLTRAFLMNVTLKMYVVECKLYLEGFSIKAE